MSDFLFGAIAASAACVWVAIIAFKLWAKSIKRKVGTGEAVRIGFVRLIPTAQADVISHRIHRLAQDVNLLKMALADRNRHLAKANGTIRALRNEIKEQRND